MAPPHVQLRHGSSNNCTGELTPAGDDTSVSSSNFECSICLEMSQDPVVTMCGHLFCWSCLHRWISIHSTVQECPVCKACVKEKIIPLYGRGKVGGFADSTGIKTANDFVLPRPPRARQNYVAAAASVPSYTPGFQHRHDLVSQENYMSRGHESTFSATSYGIFPALFGVHMISLPDYGSRFSTGSAYGASLRSQALGHVTSQQQRLNAHALQECVLYWFSILLACFAVLCFLFF